MLDILNIQHLSMVVHATAAEEAAWAQSVVDREMANAGGMDVSANCQGSCQ